MIGKGCCSRWNSGAFLLQAIMECDILKPDGSAGALFKNQLQREGEAFACITDGHACS